MFDLRICSFNESVHNHDTWATKTVSLMDPDSVITKGFILSTRGNKQHLKVYCHDIIDETDKNKENPVIPNENHVDQILNFTNDLTNNDRLLIHCHAGVSRSTATAISVLVQHGLTPHESIERVFHIRPIMWPNEKIIEVADKLLNQNGKLISALEEWQDEHLYDI